MIYDPLRDELFTASKGDGAFLNDRRMRVTQARKSARRPAGTGFPVSPARPSRRPAGMTRALLREAEDIRRTGSAALDLAYVAAGRLDGFFEIGLKPWDMTAGCLLVREAGGHYLRFRRPRRHSRQRQPDCGKPPCHSGHGQGDRADGDAGAAPLLILAPSFFYPLKCRASARLCERVTSKRERSTRLPASVSLS